jgi:AcrR family transcriptional regulator
MLAFWRHGYETTSVSDLTSAMGITAPSLYTAFGDKKQLFLEAVRLYAGDPETARRAIDDASSARLAARDLLTSAAISYTGKTTPPGCLLASATASGSAESREVQKAVAEVRRRLKLGIKSRIERDIAEAELPSETDADALSGLVIAVAQGMSVLARDGASRQSLLAIAEASLCAWPEQKPQLKPQCVVTSDMLAKGNVADPRDPTDLR